MISLLPEDGEQDASSKPSATKSCWAPNANPVVLPKLAKEPGPSVEPQEAKPATLKKSLLVIPKRD